MTNALNAVLDAAVFLEQTRVVVKASEDDWIVARGVEFRDQILSGRACGEANLQGLF